MITSVLSAIQVRYALFYSYFNGGSGERGGGACVGVQTPSPSDLTVLLLLVWMPPIPPSPPPL